MSGQFLPPDHDKGDANTLGGYGAVHARPAAFEGSDGFSYSVEIMTDETGEEEAPWGAYLLFVRWARLGAQSPEGHLESPFLATGSSAAAARDRIAALPLSGVKSVLDELIAGQAPPGGTRRWWDAMREEDGGP
jgi:hypothetical protein